MIGLRERNPWQGHSLLSVAPDRSHPVRLPRFAARREPADGARSPTRPTAVPGSTTPAPTGFSAATFPRAIRSSPPAAGRGGSRTGASTIICSVTAGSGGKPDGDASRMAPRLRPCYKPGRRRRPRPEGRGSRPSSGSGPRPFRHRLAARSARLARLRPAPARALCPRPGPYGDPFLLEWRRYFWLSLYFDLLGAWLIAGPFFLLWLIAVEAAARAALAIGSTKRQILLAAAESGPQRIRP